jgi:hypothetical protein
MSGRRAYAAQERAWVARILARLTTEQRVRYVVEMRQQSGHAHSGKKYDNLRAAVAERIMYEDRMATTRSEP